MTVSKILDKGIAGERLERDEIQILFDRGGLLELGQAADAVRRRMTDEGVASYIIDRNINYTNICIYRCRFCAFYRTKEPSDAYLLPFAALLFLWFIVALRGWIRGTQHRRNLLISDVQLVSGTVFTALFLHLLWFFDLFRFFYFFNFPGSVFTVIIRTFRTTRARISLSVFIGILIIVV